MSTSIDDSSLDIIATARRIATIAAAGYQLYKAYDIAKVEWEIGKKYYNIAQKWLDYYKDYYAPVEDQELREAMALEKETPNYDTARGRARVAAWITFRGKFFDIYKNTTRYMTGRRAYILTSLITAQANAVAQADSLGYRNERAYVKMRNDIRFKKMLNTVKRGRDMATEPVSFAKDALGSYGDLWKGAWKAALTVGTTAGYSDTRNETIYSQEAVGVSTVAGSVFRPGSAWSSMDTSFKFNPYPPTTDTKKNWWDFDFTDEKTDALKRLVKGETDYNVWGKY